MSRYLRRGLAAALIGATGAGVGAFAGQGAAAQVSVGNACHYSYDGSWRSQALDFDATTTLPDSGNLAAHGQLIAAGQRIGLADATLTAQLPAWLGEFALGGGLLSEGVNSFPLQGEIILEATNTAERYQRVQLQGNATISVQSGAGEGGSVLIGPFVVDNLTMSPVEWTATGGRVIVRQATGHALREVPGGHPVNQPSIPDGSGYVFLTMANGLHFRLQCLPGNFDLGGDSHTATLAQPISVTEVPGFVATAEGAPLAGFEQLRADVIQRGTPPSFPARDDRWNGLLNPEDEIGLEADLQLTLSGAQVWSLAQRLGLGAGTHQVQVDGSVALAATNASPATTSVPLNGAPIHLEVGANEASTLGASVIVPLATSQWTQGAQRNVPGRIRVGADGALPGGGAARLSFTAQSDESVSLNLTRLRPDGVNTPVAEINPTAFLENSWDPGPVDPNPPGGPPALDPPSAGPPALSPPGGAAPPPTGGPAPTPPLPPTATVRRVASVPTGRLSGDRRHRVAVRVRCAGNAVCRGTVQLQSAQSLRVGNRRPARVILGRAAYAVPAGATRVVRVTIPRASRAAFTTRRPQLAARVTLTPRRGEGRASTVRRVVRVHALTQRA